MVSAYTGPRVRYTEVRVRALSASTPFRRHGKPLAGWNILSKHAGHLELVVLLLLLERGRFHLTEIFHETSPFLVTLQDPLLYATFSQHTGSRPVQEPLL